MRKETTFIATEGRDKGKFFALKEMSCVGAEKWALRALSAAARSGVDVSDVTTGGMAGVAIMGIEAMLKVPFDEAEPLLDELFACVRIIRDPKHPEMTFELVEDDVEEVQTRLHIRMEVLKLHVGFLGGVGTSSSTAKTTPEKSEESSLTPTSQHSSAPRSRIVRQR